MIEKQESEGPLSSLRIIYDGRDQRERYERVWEDLWGVLTGRSTRQFSSNIYMYTYTLSRSES